jgi:hypothetical protein
MSGLLEEKPVTSRHLDYGNQWHTERKNPRVSFILAILSFL